MTKSELRETNEYREIMDKIKSYPKDFTFTIQYGAISSAKGNALRIITKDAIKKGILESTAIGLNIQGEPVEETYRRL